MGDDSVPQMVLEAKEARKAVLERVRQNRAILYTKIKQKWLNEHQ